MFKNVFQNTWKTECKIKQYLNYILLIINQNILVIQRTFPNLQKYFKNFTPSRQLPKLLLLTKFFSKIPNRNKISNEQFNLCEAKIYLDEIIKSINSQTNNKSSGSDVLTTEFYKHFFNELVPVLLGAYESGGIWVPWVLLLE